MKKIIHLGSSKDDIEKFSPKAKQRIAVALDILRSGQNLNPQEFKYMSAVGMGAYELRIKVERQYRVIYVAKFEEAIYILHAFVKKPQKTTAKDLNLAADRYRALIDQRLK